MAIFALALGFFLYSYGESFITIEDRDLTTEFIKVDTYEAGFKKGNTETPPQTCSGDMPCGPCPGICWQSKGKKKTNLPVGAHDSGWRECTLTLAVNQMTMAWAEPADEDPGDGKSHFPNDWNIGDELSQYMGYDSIVIDAGAYTLDYSSNPYRTAVVDVTLY
ncbi:MAG: hypothetical protein H6606_02165 [Flavobacteriales bacterium]|nr:hypothetical protein [Flavobacteriales bacterium]